MRITFLPAALSTLLLIAACSSGSSSSPAAGGGACGVVVFGSDYAASCQATLDKSCCEQEKVCAANASCRQLIACFNACPPPRKDACINACGGSGVSPPGFDAIGACSKSASFDPTARCQWPQ